MRAFYSSLLLLFAIPIFAQVSSHNVPWEQVENYQKKGLYAQASALLEPSFNHAIQTQNTNELYKIILYLLHFDELYKTQGLIERVQKLEIESKSFTPPSRHIINSLIAELYYNYYQRNYMRIKENKTSGSNKIDNWTSDEFQAKITELYLASLENSEELYKHPITDYELIFAYDEERLKAQPTVYEALAFRALDYFTSDSSTWFFDLAPIEFKSNQLFTKDIFFAYAELAEEEYQPHAFEALKIFQELTKKAITQKQKDLLVITNCKRLLFVYNHAIHKNKEKAYRQALINFYKQHKNKDYAFPIIFTILDAFYKKESTSNLKKDHKFFLKYEKIAKKHYANHINFDQMKRLLQLYHKTDFSINMENVTPPNETIKLHVSFKNTKKINVDIITIEKEDQIKIEQQIANIKTEKEKKEIIINYLRKKPVLYNNSYQLLKKENPFFQSTEIAIPKLPSGNYACISSEAEKNINFSTLNVFTVSTYLFLTKKNPDTTHTIMLKERENGNFLSATKVELLQTYKNESKLEYKIIQEYETDEQGRFVTAPLERGNFYLRIKTIEEPSYIQPLEFGSEYANPIKYSQFYQYQSPLHTDTTKSLLFTDAAIYTPAQSIHCKGIVYENSPHTPLTNEINRGLSNNSVLPYEQIRLQILNPFNKEITSTYLRTNKFGSFHYMFQIDEKEAQGVYQIICYDKTNRQIGRTRINLTSYNKPTFEIIDTTPEKIQKLNKEIEISLDIKTLNLIPLQNIPVQYTITKKILVPYRMYPSFKSTELVEKGELHTNKEGHVSLIFSSTQDSQTLEKNEKLIYHIDFQAIGNQKDVQFYTKTIVIGKEEIRPEITLKEEWTKEDEFINATINTYTINNQEVMTKGKWLLYYKKNSFNQSYRNPIMGKVDFHYYSKRKYAKLFPYDEYSTKNDTKTSQYTKKIAQGTYKNALEIQIPIKKKMKTGQYLLVFKPHKYSPFSENEWSKEFNLSSFTHKEKGFTTPVGMICQEKNGKIEMAIVGEGKNHLIELFHQGKLLEEKISNSNFYSFTIPDKLNGEFTVCLTTLIHNRVYSFSQNIEYIPNKNNLIITIDKGSQQPPYVTMPGSNENWQIKVHDDKGNPMHTELTLTIFDAALEQIQAHDFPIPQKPNFPIEPWQAHLHSSINYSTIIAEQTILDFQPPQFVELHYYGLPINTHYARPLMTRSMGNLNFKESAQVDTLNDAHSEEALEIRTDFRSTAFFVYETTTNHNGEAFISFKLPDSLTRWKTLVFAHTPHMVYGMKQEEFIAQKPLTIQTQLPMMLRSNDKITLNSEVQNSTSDEMNAVVSIKVEAQNDKNNYPNISSSKKLVHEETKNIEIAAKSSHLVSWNFDIPEGVQELKVQTEVLTKTNKDAEAQEIPIYSDLIHTTHSLPFYLEGNDEIIVNSLPQNEYAQIKVMTSTYPLVLNSLAYSLNAQQNTNDLFVLFSNLLLIEKHASMLKPYFENIKLAPNNSPWANKSNLDELKKLLNDTTYLLARQNEIKEKLLKSQDSTGGLNWFHSSFPNRAVTQTLLYNIYFLNLQKNFPPTFLSSMFHYLEKEFLAEYERNILNNQMENISTAQLYFMLTHAYSPTDRTSTQAKEAINYYLQIIEDSWHNYALAFQKQVMMALVCQKLSTIQPKLISICNAMQASFLDIAIMNNQGMHWKGTEAGDIVALETQILLSHFLNQFSNNPYSKEQSKLINKWLLLNGSSQNQSVFLNYYFMQIEEKDNKQVHLPNIIVTTNKSKTPQKIDEPQTTFNHQLTTLTIQSKSSYPQFGVLNVYKNEKLASIQASQDIININRNLYTLKETKKGMLYGPVAKAMNLKVGTRLAVVFEIESTLPIPFVRIQDYKGAQLAMLDQNSGRRYSNGTEYYINIEKEKNEIFLERLPKGKTSFSYEVLITHEGIFSDGYASLESLYTNSLQAHSQGGTFTSVHCGR